MKWRPAGLIVVGLLVLGITVWLAFNVKEDGCAAQKTTDMQWTNWEEFRAQSLVVGYRELLTDSDRYAGQCIYIWPASVVQVIIHGEDAYDFLIRVFPTRTSPDYGLLLLVEYQGQSIGEGDLVAIIGEADGLVKRSDPDSGQRISVPRLKALAVNVRSSLRGGVTP